MHIRLENNEGRLIEHLTQPELLLSPQVVQWNKRYFILLFAGEAVSVYQEIEVHVIVAEVSNG